MRIPYRFRLSPLVESEVLEEPTETSLIGKLSKLESAELPMVPPLSSEFCLWTVIRLEENPEEATFLTETTEQRSEVWGNL